MKKYLAAFVAIILFVSLFACCACGQSLTLKDLVKDFLSSNSITVTLPHEDTGESRSFVVNATYAVKGYLQKFDVSTKVNKVKTGSVAALENAATVKATLGKKEIVFYVVSDGAVFCAFDNEYKTQSGTVDFADFSTFDAMENFCSFDNVDNVDYILVSERELSGAKTSVFDTRSEQRMQSGLTLLAYFQKNVTVAKAFANEDASEDSWAYLRKNVGDYMFLCLQLLNNDGTFDRAVTFMVADDGTAFFAYLVGEQISFYVSAPNAVDYDGLLACYAVERNKT